MKGLTKKQAIFLAEVCRSLDEIDRAPSIREMTAFLGLGESSTNAAARFVTALARKGYIKQREPRVARALVPLLYPDGRPFLSRRDLLGLVKERDEEIALHEAHLDELQARIACLEVELGHGKLTISPGMVKALQGGGTCGVLKEYLEVAP